MSLILSRVSSLGSGLWHRGIDRIAPSCCWLQSSQSRKPLKTNDSYPLSRRRIARRLHGVQCSVQSLVPENSSARAFDLARVRRCRVKADLGFRKQLPRQFARRCRSNSSVPLAEGPIQPRACRADSVDVRVVEQHGLVLEVVAGTAFGMQCSSPSPRSALAPPPGRTLRGRLRASTLKSPPGWLRVALDRLAAVRRPPAACPVKVAPKEPCRRSRSCGGTGGGGTRGEPRGWPASSGWRRCAGRRRENVGRASRVELAAGPTHTTKADVLERELGFEPVPEH